MADAPAAAPDDAAARPELDRLRFIPFRRSDLLSMLRSTMDSEGSAALIADFEAGVERIGRAFADEFHTLRQELKDCYAPLDPDADTRNLHVLPSTDGADSLAERLAELLNRANYEALSDADLRRAFRSASLFQISLRVNMKDFEEVLLHCRGARECEETILVFGGLFKRRIRFTSYDRVMLYLRFSEQAAARDPEVPAGRVMVKLFQNVPDADLEMLFPNTQVAMRWTDRFLIGVPAVASGAILAFTKLGAPLVLLGALLGYWLGANSEPPMLDKQGLLVIAAGLGAVVAYIWKQLSNYRTRKARFRQALTRNLYFKLLDNNAGVLLRILDDAEDSECKEAWVALRFLLEAPQGLCEAELDQRIEAWFEEVCGATLDFEIDDALKKLQELGLAERRGELWQTSGAAPGEHTAHTPTMDAADPTEAQELSTEHAS